MTSCFTSSQLENLCTNQSKCFSDWPRTEINTNPSRGKFFWSPLTDTLVGKRLIIVEQSSHKTIKKEMTERPASIQEKIENIESNFFFLQLPAKWPLFLYPSSSEFKWFKVTFPKHSSWTNEKKAWQFLSNNMNSNCLHRLCFQLSAAAGGRIGNCVKDRWWLITLMLLWCTVGIAGVMNLHELMSITHILFRLRWFLWLKVLGSNSHSGNNPTIKKDIWVSLVNMAWKANWTNFSLLVREGVKHKRQTCFSFDAQEGYIESTGFGFIRFSTCSV